MPIPDGYLPRKGDIVLVQARAKRDAYPNEPDIQCYFEVVGHETSKFFTSVSEIHSLYARNWEIGDTVSHAVMFQGPGEIIAVDGDEVWVRDTEMMRWTIEANELEPYVEPVPAPATDIGTDGPMGIEPEVAAQYALQVAPPSKVWPEAPGGAIDDDPPM